MRHVSSGNTCHGGVHHGVCLILLTNRDRNVKPRKSVRLIDSFVPAICIDLCSVRIHRFSYVHGVPAVDPSGCSM